MSEESATRDPIERSRALLEATNRGDLDAMMGFYAADSIWDSPPLGTSFEGVAAIRGFYEDWMSTYDELEFELEEILDLGHGVTFAVAPQDARPVGSTGRVRARLVLVSEWVDGMAVRVTVYFDIDEARAAAHRLAEERAEESKTLGPVELTRRAYESFSRRDRDLDVVMRDYDDDSVFDMSPAGLGSFQGVAAIRGLLEDWIAAYEEYEIEPEQILDLGNGVVFAVICQNARPAHSTGNVRFHHGNVFVWEEGVIVRVTHYNDIDEARAAAERLAESRE